MSAKTRIEGWRKRGEGSMTDQELLISTLRKAGQILGEYYLEPQPRDAVSNGRITTGNRRYVRPLNS